MKKEVFNKQVSRLTIEYADKGFTMPKERALQWYERFKDIEDSDFVGIVDYILNSCSYPPCMADLVKGYEVTKPRRELPKWRPQD
jgi:hypothetical protein